MREPTLGGGLQTLPLKKAANLEEITLNVHHHCRMTEIAMKVLELHRNEIYLFENWN